MQPKVTLLNWTPDPIATVWALWESSKIDGPVPLDIAEIRRTVPTEKLEKLFWDVLRQQIPVGEHVNFVFVFEGVSVSWREQAVRHRIGTRVGDRVGIDIVPDLAESTWWSQSMRLLNMSDFADREMYRVPDTLEGKEAKVGPVRLSANMLFKDTMLTIQQAYSALVAAGVPMEDARELIPLGAQHRISWGLNMQALLHILSKRGCFILQQGLWGPIILGMVEELVKKVHPMFSRIVAPPCIKDGKFNSCLYRLENQRRLDGSDAHPTCPLYLCKDEDGRGKLADAIMSTGAPFPETSDEAKSALIHSDNLVPRHREMKQRAEEYRKLWHRDPYTFAPEGAPK